MSAQLRLAVLAACAVMALVGTAFAVQSTDLGPPSQDGSTGADARDDRDNDGRDDRRSGDRRGSDRLSPFDPEREGCGPAASQRLALTDDLPTLLSNGCAVSERGIPECGTLFGSSLTANGDPTEWERDMGDHLGVRRTYFQAWHVDRAIETVEADTAVGRVPWISFKPPHSWREMATGKGDAWARDLATRLSQVDGPVWLAIHHEPENDGDIRLWTRMQERLAPMVRRLAPNVAYSIILTGWNAWSGTDPAHRLDSLYPNTTIDLLGFDIYNKYGGRSGGSEQTDMKARFFDRIAPWAEAHDVAWGVAETGYRDVASQEVPEWLSVTYDQMVATGGVALTYWNSTLGADLQSDFSLDQPQELRAFGETLRRSPKLKSEQTPHDSCVSDPVSAGRG